MTRHKTYTIYNWKKRGVISNDYSELYDYHININNCELCNVLFDKTSKNLRCLDHDHHTGLYRKTLCNSCNAHYLKKSLYNPSGHKWICILNSKKEKYISWRFMRTINKKEFSKCFKSKTKCIALSFIYLLKYPN